MQKVTDKYKELLNTSMALTPKAKIEVDGKNYVGDVIKTSPKISHSNSSFVGGFPAKTVSFDIYNIKNDLDFVGKEVIVYKGLVVEEKVEWVKQGIFIPQSKNVTNNISTKVISISNAQDRTQLLDDKYESSLDWSNGTTHTGLEIVQEICNKKNLKLENIDFAWANYPFKQPNFSETITNREVISRLAEIGGEIALFTTNGTIAIKGQYKTGDTVQRRRYQTLTRESPYIVNTLVLGKDGANDDIIFPETISKKRIEYQILDNPFVDLYREEMIETVAKYIIGKSYTPFNLNNFVDGFIYELNDVLNVIDKNGNIFEAVLLDYSTSNRIKSNIKAGVENKTSTDYKLAGSNKEAINQVRLDVDHIKGIIEALSQRIEDLSDYLRSENGVGNITLANTVESDGAIGKLVITGFTEKDLYPGMVYPSKNSFPGKLTAYTIIQTDGTVSYETYIDLGRPLTINDELVIENNKVYLKTGTKITDMDLKVTLKTFDGSTTISVKYFDDVNLSCDYLIENDLTKIFATQAELSSVLKITNESISTKVTKAELVSEINQSAEEIKIEASKLNLNGYISNKEGSFEITEDGKAKFRDVTIYGGNINLPNGGKVVGGDGILTNLQYSTPGVYGGYDILGFERDDSISDTFVSRPKDLSLDVYIPRNFTIVEAKVIVFHTPADWYLYDVNTNNYSEVWGYCRNIKLFKSDGTQNYKFVMGYYSEYKLELDTSVLQEIENSFGDDGYTATNNTGSSIQTRESIDIKEYLKTGNNKIVVRSSLNNPTTEREMLSENGMARAIINVIGYMSTSEE